MSLRRSPRGLPSPEVRELRASAMVRQMRKQAGSQKKHAASHADDVHANHGYSVNDADSIHELAHVLKICAGQMFSCKKGVQIL